ncbi:MAG: GNAT family N-acetyltransferase [Blastocatellia bacterium]|nr:GNAT family N-acetyltransferase [Blastocatellia bacterium]
MNTPTTEQDNQVLIRRAVPADLDILVPLSFDTFYDAFHDHPKNAPDDLATYMEAAFNREQIESELADPANIFLIAKIDGETAGYAKLTLDAREEGITAERPIELNRLYSHQRFLGSGVGRYLMDECLSVARRHSCDVMWLGVWEFNPRAQRFYEKHGFRVVGRHTFQLGSDPQIDLLMQREL